MQYAPFTFYKLKFTGAINKLLTGVCRLLISVNYVDQVLLAHAVKSAPNQHLDRFSLSCRAHGRDQHTGILHSTLQLSCVCVTIVYFCYFFHYSVVLLSLLPFMVNKDEYIKAKRHVPVKKTHFKNLFENDNLKRP